MSVAKRNGRSASNGTRLVDLWFTLAVIVGAIHLHTGARALRRALAGDASLLLPILILGAAIGTGVLLVAYETASLPRETIYTCGITLSGLLLFAYVDVTVLGIVTPALGLDAGANGPAVPMLLDRLQSNGLALTSKLAELSMAGVLTGLYLNSSSSLPLGKQSHTVTSAAEAARANRRDPPRADAGPAQDVPGRSPQPTQQDTRVAPPGTAGRQQEHAVRPPAQEPTTATGASAGTMGTNAASAGVTGGAVDRGEVGVPGARSGHPTPEETVTEDETDVGLLERLGQPPSWGLLCMRLALAMVFIVFGFKKMWPASPAEPVVEHTVFFFAHAEFFWLLGFWETLVGVALLRKRTLRFAAWLFFFQMAGTLLGLIFFVEGTWHVFPIYPTDIGTYIIKNFIFLGAAMVLVIGYTGSEVREPPLERLNSETMRDLAMKFHWTLSTWVPRHSLTFLRGTIVTLLVLFGLKTMAGKGSALVNVQIALNELLGLGLSVGMVYFILGGLKTSSGLLLLSNNQKHMTYAVVTMSAYIFLGLLPMVVTPEIAFFEGWLIAPAFATLWFLKDFVTLGGIWTIRDLDHEWQPSRALGAARDAIEVLLTWCGVDTTAGSDPRQVR
jgi:uncharacterized membrane protein YphA (DoxX/SURF4 family)